MLRPSSSRSYYATSYLVVQEGHQCLDHLFLPFLQLLLMDPGVLFGPGDLLVIHQKLLKAGALKSTFINIVVALPA